MNKSLEHIQKAQHYLRTSDHIVTTTYAVVQEPKVLVSSLENIFLALTNSLSAILYHARLQRKIPPFHNTFESKFNMFQLRIIELYPYTKEDVAFIEKIYNLVLFHKKSPVEFSRKSEFVMCSDSYSIEKLSVTVLQGFMKRATDFLQKTTELVRV